MFYTSSIIDSSNFEIPKSEIERILEKYGVTGLHHMTHISNLEGILKHGLLSHNAAQQHQHIDISNTDVNNRRNVTFNEIDRNLHDYVPFYFNIRNAMLYRVREKQPEKDSIIVLEYDSFITRLNKTDRWNILYTNKNAAADSALFYNSIDDREIFKFDDIFNINNIYFSDQYIKQTTMAEILIYNKVNTDYLLRIHTSSQRMKEAIEEYLIENSFNIEVIYNKEMFEGF